MRHRPTENEAFRIIEKKDRIGLAASRSIKDSYLIGGGELFKHNTINNYAPYRLDVRKPERTQKEIITPLYNMGVMK